MPAGSGSGAGSSSPVAASSFGSGVLAFSGMSRGTRPSVCMYFLICTSTPERSNTTCNRHNNRLKSACTM